MLEHQPPDPHRILGPRDSPRWLLLLVSLGVLLRACRYAQDWPLWWNEAFVAVNLFHRDFAGLLRPLDYRQVCPIGFLWVEKLAIELLGASEWTLRVLPLLASLGSLAVFARAAWRAASPRAALLAVGLLAIAYHPVRLGSELKPYSFDLLAAAIVLERAIAWRSDRASRAPIWHLTLLTPALMLLSYPAALVIAGIAATLAWEARSARPSARLAWVAWLGSILTSAVVVRALAAGQAAAAKADPLNEYLHDGFPASWHLIDLSPWLANLATGRLFAFPFGDAGFPALLGLTLALLGLLTITRRDRGLGLLLAAPFIANIAAALAGLYPLGGHPRVSQHLMPTLALTIGFGIDTLLARLGPREATRRARIAGLAALLVVGGLPLLRDATHPFRTPRDLAARRFARDFWPAATTDARVICLRRDLGLLPVDDANPDVALYLANRSLYEPRGNPSSPSVRRYVLYYAPGLDRPRITGWLAQVSLHFTLHSHVTHDLPDHGTRGARVEVFEVGPTPAPGTTIAGSIKSIDVR